MTEYKRNGMQRKKRRGREKTPIDQHWALSSRLYAEYAKRLCFPFPRCLTVRPFWGRPRRVTSLSRLLPYSSSYFLQPQNRSPSGLPKPAFWLQAFFLALVASFTPTAGSWEVPTTTNYDLPTTASSNGGFAGLGFPGLSDGFLQHLF